MHKVKEPRIKEQNPNFLKRHKKGLLIAVGTIIGVLILLGLMARSISKLMKATGIFKTSIVRVTIPKTTETEPFDIYLGAVPIDGSGEYYKLNKVSDTVWEAQNKFGEDEKDVDDWVVLKVKKSDQELPSSVAGQTKILARVNGEEFQRGALIVDYWSKDWDDTDIAGTNKEMKASNINWAFLAPAWDITSVDPVKIWNDEGGQIQYDEAQLRNHIKKLTDDGIKVVMGPQLCCTPVPDKLEKSKEWWDEYFSQFENYMLYHARIAEETGTEVFVFSFGAHFPGSGAGAPADAEARWEKMLTKVREVYHGKVATFDYLWGRYNDNETKTKSALFESNMKLLEKFDLFVVSMWNPVSDSMNPTQEELNKNVAKLLDDKVKFIYEKYKKPIIIEPAYRSADGASIGTEKYEVWLISTNPAWKDYVDVEVQQSGLFKSMGTVKNKIPYMTYDGREQAMVYEAIYKATAERPWITGIYPFIYHMKGFDFLRHPDYDIRRKPVEQILKGWYENFGKVSGASNE